MKLSPISILFLMGKKYILGQKKTKYVVTADKTAVTLSSKKIVDALPEFIGNKRVIANDECDICNDHFSMFVEDHFAKFMGASRTLSQVKGKGCSFPIKRNKVIPESISAQKGSRFKKELMTKFSKLTKKIMNWS